jgi:hypothetical protein
MRDPPISLFLRTRPACQRAVSAWLPCVVPALCARRALAARTPCPRHKRSAHSVAVRTPPPAPTSPRAPLTAVVQSHAPLSAPDRACLTVPRHRRWQATPTASALVRPSRHCVFTLNRPCSPLSATITLPSHLSTVVPEHRPRLAVYVIDAAVYPI